METTTTYSVHVPANLDNALLVRNAARNVLEQTDMPYTWVYRLVLIVDELFMNAVKYGSSTEEQEIIVRILRDDEKVVFEIEDTGNAGEHSLSPEELEEIIAQNKKGSRTRLSGRGLALIAQTWADDMKVKKGLHGGLVLHVEKLFKNCTLKQHKNLYLDVDHPKREVCIHFLQELFHERHTKEFLRLFRMLKDYPNYHFIFDLEQMKFLTKKNIGKIVELYARLRERGEEVRFIHISRHSKAFLQKVGLDTLIKEQ